MHVRSSYWQSWSAWISSMLCQLWVFRVLVFSMQGESNLYAFCTLIAKWERINFHKMFLSGEGCRSPCSFSLSMALNIVIIDLLLCMCACAVCIIIFFQHFRLTRNTTMSKCRNVENLFISKDDSVYEQLFGIESYCTFVRKLELHILTVMVMVTAFGVYTEKGTNRRKIELLCIE